MNIQAIQAFLNHSMLSCVEISPVLSGDDFQRVYLAFVVIKTLDKKTLELPFTTDRPFFTSSEAYEYFARSGVPRRQIFLVMPRGSDNYINFELTA